MIDFRLIFAVLITQIPWILPLFVGRSRTSDQHVHHDMPLRAQEEGILDRDIQFRWVDKKKVRKTRSREQFEVFYGYDNEAKRHYRFLNPSGQVLMAKKIS